MTMTDLIIDSIQDIKGKHIVKMDLREIDEAPADFFIVCEGDSSTQVSAIARNINKRVKDELGIRASLTCLLCTSPSPRDKRQSRMSSSA